MITQVRAGPYTLRGVSVGGVYTTLHVPELDAVLDVGLALRSFASVGRFFLSHGHLDHVAGLAGLLNIRGLVGSGKATIHLPAEIEEPIRELLRAHTALSRAELAVELVPMLPGDERSLGHGMFVRALRTHHPVPSLGYQFVRRVARLRPEHQGKAPEEIARLRKEGADGLFEEHERLELAYATDTLSRVLESSPSLFESRVLVLECTFVDGTRTVEHARRKFHLHLDELVELAPRFHNEALVLMHFGQGSSPDAVRAAVERRLPPGLRERVVVFAPEGDRWFG
ncbi:MAG: MBL fold metallo-hydrolase [Deltaproteobacteria bacterium]|nr:MBL fold metallo-hydrolase [Myxococcales bacterium]MDP3217266.1 MBL fold metallo-hydrolase [Deltaproteobacteria bacterium]